MTRLRSRSIICSLFGGDVTFPPPAETFIEWLDGERREFRTSDGSILVLDFTGRRPFAEWEGQDVTNVLLRSDDEQGARLSAANQMTERLFRGFLAGDVNAQLEHIVHRDPDAWLPRLQDGVRFLEETFGRLESARVLHSVFSPDDHAVIETFVALELEAGQSATRVLWSDGKLWSVSDRGAFIGASRSVAVQPGRVYLSGSGSHLVGYDPHWDETVGVRVLRDDGGTVTALEIRNGDHAVSAGSPTVSEWRRQLSNDN